ncbi:DUF885 domain-containing protein [Catenovulum sp. SM1970]|uniref:DUF885 domain-containing protein n=1 Tax=Marinifaba aquimaris TaxID=2741323 RepID=UPI0015738CD9|nr:DUF885 domain-containing protein [Marinifaba aquimaris]NTS75526.1 DUF885 domain-containing protein [Marinifaba aquimaris]
MKKTLVASAILFSLVACSSQQAPSQNTESTAVSAAQTQAVNQAFNDFKHHFIEEYWVLSPDHAVYAGRYELDGILVLPDMQQREAEKRFAEKKLIKLGRFDIEQLNENNASDYHIIKNELESILWYNKSLKRHEWDPSIYNVANTIGLILNTPYKSLEERLLVVLRRMEKVPAYYQAAAISLNTPTIPHTELAIQQNKGAMALFKGKLPKLVNESSLSSREKNVLLESAEKSTLAINDYVTWLESKLVELKTNGNAKDFRIGEALYEEKFALDIFSDLTAEQLYNKAVAEKKRVHGEIIKITDKLWPKYFADTAMPADKLKATKQLIDHISVKNVKRDEFVSSIRAQIPELEAFVYENNLIEMDLEKPLVVRETPEYMRGYAGASISAPGPYDAKANTYYNVTPLDNFTDEQAESYLREYNHWLLQILNIHEAVPGHYTQLVHSNKSPSLIKSIFGNGAMVEGWAVYTERMMLEQGYGDFEPELWLMYYKWNLRVIVNAILDYSIQVKGMSEQQAMDLMVNEAFQEQAEAAGKWRRATLSQVQLTSYFTGYSEIYALREALKSRTGQNFNLTNFHNQFLSYGSAPVPIIKKMMFSDYVKNH